MIEKKLFGRLSSGIQIFLYCIKNKNGSQVNIINYGAIVTNLFVKDKKGSFDDVVLGYDNIDGYLNDNFYLGAIVGRFGNRIAGGCFSLNGKHYRLAKNDGNNHLHGGHKGFSKVIWEADAGDEKGNSLKLNYISKDGEEGYPGEVALSVVYRLTDQDELEISYEGKTDKTTILNPTHHSYFNLTGDFTKTILNHKLKIDADKFTPAAEDSIPTGEIVSVDRTPLDFRSLTPVGLRITGDFSQLKYGKGYDHNWVLNNYNSKVRHVADVYEPESGRLMNVFTNEPGLQFYSGNHLDGTRGKNGISYKTRTGLCLETQHFPDSPNKSAFPSVVLKPGEIYKQTTIYKFSVKT